MIKTFLGIQHRLNPLHVYCRFLDKGLSKKFSTSLTKIYEVFIFYWINLMIKISINILFMFNRRLDFKMAREGTVTRLHK